MGNLLWGETNEVNNMDRRYTIKDLVANGKIKREDLMRIAQRWDAFDLEMVKTYDTPDKRYDAVSNGYQYCLPCSVETLLEIEEANDALILLWRVEGMIDDAEYYSLFNAVQRADESLVNWLGEAIEDGELNDEQVAAAVKAKNDKLLVAKEYYATQYMQR